MEKALVLPMFTSPNPHLYISFTGQLVFIQENFLVDIIGMMGGLIYSPKTQQQRDMYNFLLN